VREREKCETEKAKEKEKERERKRETENEVHIQNPIASRDDSAVGCVVDYIADSTSCCRRRIHWQGADSVLRFLSLCDFDCYVRPRSNLSGG
jgi:hypothetical protein